MGMGVGTGEGVSGLTESGLPRLAVCVLRAITIFSVGTGTKRMFRSGVFWF